MENQSPWLNLDTAQLYKAKQKSLNGVQVNLFLPPSLIPNAVRGGFSKEEQRFVIEFRYLAPSSSCIVENVQSDDQSVVFQLDKDSGRVQKILIDVKKLNVGKVQLNVEAQVLESIRSAESHIKDSDGDWIKESIEVARNALKLKKQDLFSAVGHAF